MLVAHYGVLVAHDVCSWLGMGVAGSRRMAGARKRVLVGLNGFWWVERGSWWV